MPEDQPKDVIRFHHLKAPDFTTKHVDGALASEAIQGGVLLVFFIERYAIPQMVEHELKEDGTVGDVVKIEGKEGIIREIQTGIILGEDGARNLRDRLNEIFEEEER